MAGNVNCKLLDFNNHGTSTFAVLPPAVGIKVGVPGNANFHSGLVTFHSALKDSLNTPGMVPAGHHHH